MLRNTTAIKGYAIAASDDHLGTVSDFLFDDVTWVVRWLVVDTGTWLSGRKVLLPALALGHINPSRNEFAVRLTKQEVRDSPNIDTKRPVSRQMEASVYDYYGWSPYWTSGFYMGGYRYGLGYEPGTTWPIPVRESTLREENIATSRRSDDDPHLRSIGEVVGYHIHADDGEIGHVEDFLMEEADWSIHYLVVDTKNWWPGKRVLVSPRSVTGIDWTDNLVNINVGRQRVKDSPAYDENTRLIEPTSKNIMNTTVRFGQAISCKGRPFWILPLARMPRPPTWCFRWLWIRVCLFAATLPANLDRLHLVI